MPEVFRKFALGFAILVFGIWGIILIIAPEMAHQHFSSVDAIDHAYAGMMGAALLGLAIIALAAEIQWPSSSKALGIAVLIIVVVAANLMFGVGSMEVTPLTSMSLVSAAAVAFFLIFF